MIPDHTPARGEAQDDETSYEAEQQSWGPSRASWVNIVDSEKKKVMFEVDKPESRRAPFEVQNWVHDGAVLLDSKNHAVKDWPGLNRTLSTEIESWRWEALMRVYPWLTVAEYVTQLQTFTVDDSDLLTFIHSLLARMPHTREKKGKILPLQTPQAFTNRAYRFRIPNQIPATNPKKGSDTYKKGILNNLAKEGRADTTEGLSVLIPDQIDEVRKKNKGKFFGNSRYVVKSEDRLESTPATRKRKLPSNDDTESDSESEHDAKRPRTRTPPSQAVEHPYDNNAHAYTTDTYDGLPGQQVEPQYDNDAQTYTEGTTIYEGLPRQGIAPQYNDNAGDTEGAGIYNEPPRQEAASQYDDNAGAYAEGTNIYDGPTDITEQWAHTEQDDDSPDTTGFLQHHNEDLIPLFESVGDQGLALVENINWTSPDAVMWARRHGNEQTRQIGVYWYSPSVPRHVEADGTVVEDVVNGAFAHLYQAEEAIPGDSQLTSPYENTHGVAYPSTQCYTPAATDLFSNTPSSASAQGFPAYPSTQNYVPAASDNFPDTPSSESAQGFPPYPSTQNYVPPHATNNYLNTPSSESTQGFPAYPSTQSYIPPSNEK